MDASIAGKPMGSVMDNRSGDVLFSLDIEKWPESVGKALRVQVLQSGRPVPTIVHELDVFVPAQEDPAIFFRAPINRDNGNWVVLPSPIPQVRRPRERRHSRYTAAGRAVAYALLPRLMRNDRHLARRGTTCLTSNVRSGTMVMSTSG